MNVLTLSALLLISLSVPLAQAKTVETGSADKSGDKASEKSLDSTTDNDISQILDSMGYPELQVVPRASERLKAEAKNETGTWWATHWPVELSGLVTLGVGLSVGEREDLSSDEQDTAATVSMLTTAVGAGWIVGGVLLGAQRHYTRGAKAVAKVNGKDDRASLTRERLAEEALEKPARTMRVLQHVSVATNFTMNAVSAVYANDEGRVIAGVAAILAFLPYMFEDHTILVHNKHLEYKKKIYAPIKGASVHVDPETRNMTTLTTLAWTF